MQKDGSDKIWNLSMKPHKALRVFTLLSLFGFLCFVIANIVIYGKHTISDFLVKSHANGVTYTLIVALHTYANYCYLILASEYIGYNTVQFKIIFIATIIYLLSLVIVSYLPVDEHNNLHSIFAGLAFGFAMITVFLTKIFHVIERREIVLLFLEGIYFFILLVLAIFFAFRVEPITEYIFIALVLIEKDLKIEFLSRSNLIVLTSARLEYCFYNIRTKKYLNIPSISQEF